MATGIIRDTTIIGVGDESAAEGTYVAPQAATDYIQPLEDGFELTPARELLDRAILSSSIGQARPRVGIKSVTATLPCEFRASGTEGAAPDYDLLMESALGNKRQISARVTSGTGHTTSVINIEAADIGDFAVGDIIVVLDSGDHTVHAITNVNTTGGSEAITILPVRDSAPADNVEISQCTTYYPANSGHKPLSLSYYWANTIRQAAIGCKVESLSLENFTTGQLASWNFSMGGLTYTEVDGTAPHTPSYDSGLPPVILNACVYQDGTQIDVNNFAMTLTNTLGYITSTCSANGRTASRVTNRAISGSFDPYKDDTSVSQFSNFDNNTPYSIFLSAYTPSSTAGEIELGSVVGIYLPSVITTEKPVGNNEGILTEAISFQATAGDDGESDDIYIGFI
jgi:hypothetical protein